MNRYILTLTLGLSALFGYAQQAESLYDHLSLQDAIAEYEGIIKESPNDGEAIFNLASAYRLNNQSIKAEVWFAKAVQHSERAKAKFYYAKMLLMNGKITEAKEWFVKYKSNVVGKEALHIDNFIVLCTQIENHLVKNRYFDISKVVFNSEMMDFSPSYFGEELIFVSNRKESKGASNHLDAWTDQKYTDLFIASPLNGYEVRPFTKKINSGLHEGSAIFSKDLNTLYFTRSNQITGHTKDDKEENIRLQIMETSKEEGKWSKPKKMRFNNNEFSSCHPALSANNDFMIYASDKPGGFGGMDLYIVKKSGDEWGVPENLGDKINTSGNEVFPFIDNDGNLYFSSNYHAGFGGLDIFKAYNRSGEWKRPENIGLPLNSVRDDFGIITNDNFKSGYFSSDRTGNDEIYSFRTEESFIIEGIVINCETNEIIKGADVTIYQNGVVFKELVSDENGMFYFETRRQTGELEAKASKNLYKTTQTCTGLENFNTNDKAKIELSLGLVEQFEDTTGLNLCGQILNEDCNYLLDDVKITVINICNGDAFEVISDKNGQFNFPLNQNCKYRIKAEKGYFEIIDTIIKTDSTMSDCFDLDLKMHSTVDLRDPFLGYKGTGSNQILLKEGTVIDLYNVYFDFDKYYIREDAIEELEWVRKILNDYPGMKVEISAHTDSRATDGYNNTLSKNRAQSVTNYLMKHGIQTDRMVSLGYGETRLKNNCSDGVSCSELQHQRNRRVEFKVVSFEGEVLVSKEWKSYMR